MPPVGLVGLEHCQAWLREGQRGWPVTAFPVVDWRDVYSTKTCVWPGRHFVDLIEVGFLGDDLFAGVLFQKDEPPSVAAPSSR